MRPDAVEIGADGWAMSGAEIHPSPHFDARETAPEDVHLVVLHNISLPPYMILTLSPMRASDRCAICGFRVIF